MRGRPVIEEIATSEQVMTERASAWFESVSGRHSRRTYSGRTAEAADLDAIERICREFRPAEGVRVALVRTPAVDPFKGVMGSYGKVTGAPHLLVMIGTEDTRSHLAVGYAGQACILEATARGLGTCWIGGFFDRARVAELVELSEGERALAISPVGYPLTSHSMSERLMKRMAGSHKRKPREVIAPGVGEDSPGWACAAVECARLAPSAVNRQPWRFAMDGDALVLRTDSAPDYPTVTKELDCGIAMLHAELGARAAGATGTWRLVTDDGELARYEPDDKTRTDVADS